LKLAVQLLLARQQQLRRCTIHGAFTACLPNTTPASN
jgi:hypothetical protein